MAYTDEGHEEELVAWEREVGDRYEGDARRCPRHPNVKTSSDDGMFDGVCGLCENEMEDDFQEREYEAQMEAAREEEMVRQFEDGEWDRWNHE